MLRVAYRPVVSGGSAASFEARQSQKLFHSRLPAAPRFGTSTSPRPRVAQVGVSKAAKTFTGFSPFSTQIAVRTASNDFKSLAQRIDYKEVRIFGRAVAIIAASVAIGDFLGQMMELNFKDLFAINTDKSWTMLFWGTAIIGPITQGWHMLIEKKFPGDPVKNIIAKIFLSSSFVIFFQLALINSTGTLCTKDFAGNAGSLSDAWKKIKAELVPTATHAMVYWPIVNLILFTVISGYNRVLGRSIAAVGWKLYLTNFALNQKKKQIETSWGKQLSYSDHGAVWM